MLMGMWISGRMQLELIKAAQKELPEYIVELRPNGPMEARLTIRRQGSGHPFMVQTFETSESFDSCVVSGNLEIDPDMRNKGIGQALMRAKIAWANAEKINIFAFISSMNETQKHILKKYGWQQLPNNMWAYFYNAREGR